MSYLEDYAHEQAPAGGVLFNVNGDNLAAGLVLVGPDALTALEKVNGIEADAVPYYTVDMPCGQSHTYEDKAEVVPGVNLGCLCGFANHFFTYWVDVQPPVEETPEEPEEDEEASQGEAAQEESPAEEPTTEASADSAPTTTASSRRRS